MIPTFAKSILLYNLICLPLYFAYKFFFSGLRFSHMTRLEIKNEMMKYVFFCYVVALCSVTIVPLSITRRSPAWMNFTPVLSAIALAKFLWAQPEHNFKDFYINIVGNILLFLPLGFFLPYLYAKLNSFIKIFFISLAASALIEAIQFVEFNFGWYRIVDVDDIILNTLGGVLGYCSYKIIWFESKMSLLK